MQEERKGAGGGRAAELVVYKEGRRLKEVVVKGESDSYYSRGKWRAARLESNVYLIGNDKSAHGKLHSDECLNIVLYKCMSE